MVTDPAASPASMPVSDGSESARIAGLDDVPMIRHDRFAHSVALQCDRCPGYPHAACVPASVADAVDDLHTGSSHDGDCRECGKSWPCPTSRLVHDPRRVRWTERAS